MYSLTDLKPGSFSGRARVEEHEDGRHATFLEPLAFRTKDGIWLIEIEAGFVTDWASIPRLVNWLIPMRGKYDRPAGIHDLLYQRAPVDPRTGKPCTWTTADAIIREACECVEVAAWEREAIWAGLRAGGWVTWNKYRNGKKQLPSDVVAGMNSAAA